MFQPDLQFKSELRIDFGKIIEFNEEFYDILTSSYIKELYKLPTSGIYTVTTEAYRPDLISAKIYRGQEQYKHILMIYNNLFSYLQVTKGMTLKYPSLRDIENLLVLQSLTNKNPAIRIIQGG